METEKKPTPTRTAKKPYSPPTLTEHGGVVERTLGCGGVSCELDDWRQIGDSFPF